jgi:hypothetical protein
MEQALELRDIHLPEAVSWWPLAPGWWLLLVFVVSIIVILFLKFAKNRKQEDKHSLSNAIQQELEQLRTIENEQRFVEELSAFLKRVAISHYGRKVSGYTGEKWLRFLDDRLPESAGKPFSEGKGRILLDLPYQECPELDRSMLIDIVNNWIMLTEEKKHV